jgi:hypothetical protein
MNQDHDHTQPTSTATWLPLRIWIPLVLVPLMGLMRFVPDLVPHGPSMIWMASAFGAFLIGLLVVLWWLLASRAEWEPARDSWSFHSLQTASWRRSCGRAST